MEVGDKVICIRSYFFEGRKLNTQNKYYEIFELDYDRHNNISIRIEDDCDRFCQFYEKEFHKYFATPQKLRKLKLKKINKYEGRNE